MRRLTIMLLVVLFAGVLPVGAQGGEDGRPPITASNAADVQLLHELETSSEAYSAFFSPDSSLVASINEDNTVTVWNADSGEVVTTLQNFSADLWDAAFTPDNTLLVSLSDDNVVQVWDVASGQEVAALEECEDFAINPAGTVVAIIGSTGSIILWDVTSRQEMKPLARPAVPIARVYSAAFSPDGTLLAVAGEAEDGSGVVWLWNVTSGEALKPLHGHDKIVYRVAFSPDSHFLVSGGADLRARLWDVTSGEHLQELTRPSEVYHVTFSPDGRQVLVSGMSNEDPVLWNVASKYSYQPPLGISEHGFNSDGTLLVVGDYDGVRLLDAANPASDALLRGASYPVFSPDGTLIAAIGPKGNVQVWGISR